MAAYALPRSRACTHAAARVVLSSEGGFAMGCACGARAEGAWQ